MRNGILLVEDDIDIAKIIKAHLGRLGYKITWASTGTEGWEDYKRDSFQLIIVDLMLPEMDGFSLCKNIRLTGDHVPILILSARSEDENKIKGLKIGADDYVTKPFSLDELQARIEAHLRRYKRYLHEEVEQEKLEFNGGLTIEPEKKQVLLDSAPLSLTSKEFQLLLLLARNPERSFTKKELYEHVWEQTDVDGNNTVTVHVKGLREKLNDSIKQPKFIQTVWGAGYRFIGETL